MKRASLIGHLLELHAVCNDSRQPADHVVRSFFRSRGYLGSTDRRFISTALYGMLHTSLLLDYYRARITMDSTKPQPGIIAFAVHALRVLGEPRESVAGDLLSLGVSAAAAEQLIASILDLRSPEVTEADPVRRLSILTSLPEFAVREWERVYGLPGAADLCAALSRPARTTLRINSLRTTVEQCQDRLASEGVTAEIARFSPHALHLSGRIHLPSIGAFREGLIEIQDEGSQLISFLVNPRPGEVLVDACAGGGGKALHLAAMMKNSGVIHALELEERRFGDIRTRCSRNGVSIVRPAVANTEVLSGLRGTADAVLVDAPCTGSGTIRRNPLLRRTLSEGVLVDYVVRQREVLSAYAALVRPGGRLVYATCSLFSAENEGVVSWFLEKNARFHVVSARDVLAQSTIEIDGARTFLHILPQTTGADGFFAAVMVSA